MGVLKFPVTCQGCESVTNPVEVDISESTIQEKQKKELIIVDKQRECANCGRKWNSIQLFYDNYERVDTAYGIE